MVIGWLQTGLNGGVVTELEFHFLAADINRSADALLDDL